MKPAQKNFDRLAGVYRAMEFLAFGRDLERARFSLLHELRDCREILVLGEGDGRALARLLEAAPRARIHCVDLSAAMLERAAALISAQDWERVTFQQADVLSVTFPTKPFDAVTTLFLLDCFTARQVKELVQRVDAVLAPHALWLFVDFSMPQRGYARLRARAWLKLLFLFFRWSTAITSNDLPPSEEILARSGWRATDVREFQLGLLRAVLLHRGNENPRSAK